MASQTLCYQTRLPEDIIKIIEKDLAVEHDAKLIDSKVGGGVYGTVDKEKRNAQNSWISDQHWVTGFIWHYVQKANRENFLYDLTQIDGNSLQYTVYKEGQYYGWHSDEDYSQWHKPVATHNQYSLEDQQLEHLNQSIEKVRKLSFSLLLSDPSSYEGGNFQLMNSASKSYIAPRQQGILVVFDSRAQHRVQKVTKGVRKSIVGWTVGPRWK